MSLDLRTVFINNALVNLVCALVIVPLWLRHRKRYPGLGWWALDFIVQAPAMALVALRGRIPDFLSMVGGNVLAVAGVMALLRGLELFLAKPGPWRPNALLLAAFVGIHSYFTVFDPDLHARSMNTVVTLWVVFTQILWLLFKRVDPAMRPISRGISWVFVGLWGVSLVRVFNALNCSLPGDHDYMQSGFMESMSIMSFQFLTVALTFTLFLMVNRRLTDELMAYHQAAEAANRAKSAFVANMTHEIRTPMAAIMGFTDLLLDSGPTPQQKEPLGIIKRSSETLLVLLNDALDLARIEAGKLPLEIHPFGLRRAIEDVTRLLQPGAEAKGLELACSIQEDLPAVAKGDSARLKQVLTNLIANAIKFTERGRIEVLVRLEARRGPEDPLHVDFCIRDTGVGIPREKLDAVFEPFTQADDSIAKLHGGAGLGLSISRELVRAMGGHLAARSAEGAGSEFRFVLPFGRASEEEVFGPAAGPSARPATQPLRVLLVEDTETNRKLALHILRKRGHAVSAAVDGEHALALLKKEAFDVVLLDIGLPGMDGFAVAAAMRDPRSPPAMRGAPIIAFTAHAMPEERERCLASGMEGCLLKPFTADQLAEAVERFAPGSPDHLKPVQETAAPPADPGERPASFDGARAELLRRQPGEEWIAEEILTVFAKEVPGILAKLRAALERGDLSGAAVFAHACKGASATAGFTGAQALAARMEASAKAGSAREARDLLEQLQRHLKGAGIGA